MSNCNLEKETVIKRGFTAERYVDAHEALRRNSNQRRQIFEWFQNTGMLEAGCDKVVPSVLSVGSGAGDIDCGLIDHLERRGGPFAYDAVDPNSEALSRFRNRCGEMDYSVVNRVWLYECGFEQFEAGNGYDLIHIVHSIYGIADVAGMMQKAFRLLGTGGTMGVMCSTDEGINRFKRRVFDVIDLPDRAGRVREHALVDALSRLEGASLQFEIVPSEIDVTGCIEGTPDGDLLMSFFLQCEFESLEGGEQVAALQVLSEVAQERDGRMFLNQPMMGVTARKRQPGRRCEVSLKVRGTSEFGRLSTVAVSA
jgi:SAM-dependent methyltransferase